MQKSKVNKHITMFRQVNMLMEANLEKWKAIDKIRKTYDEFVNHLKNIMDLQPDLEKDLEPLKAEWEQKRKILVSKAFPVGNILIVYAEDHNRKQKFLAGMSWNKMNSLKYKDLLKSALSIQKTAASHSKEKLEGYGLTSSMIEELDDAVKQCTYAFKMRSDILSNRKKTRKKSRKHFKAVQTLLNDRLDKLMTVFSGTHPSFYQEYLKTRRL